MKGAPVLPPGKVGPVALLAMLAGFAVCAWLWGARALACPPVRAEGGILVCTRDGGERALGGHAFQLGRRIEGAPDRHRLARCMDHVYSAVENYRRAIRHG